MNLFRVIALPIGLALSSVSCSDPPAPPAEAAFVISVGSPTHPTPNQSCQTGHPEASMPADDDMHSVLSSLESCAIGDGTGCHPDDLAVTNGKGADICCVVAPTADGFSVTLNAKYQGLTLAASGDVTSTGGTLTMSSYAPKTSTNLVGKDANETPSCTLTIASPNKGRIAAGTIWGTFTCDPFQDPSSPSTSQCAATGALLFENCKTSGGC